MIRTAPHRPTVTDWCAGCDEIRDRAEMGWHHDLYRCSRCTGKPEVMAAISGDGQRRVVGRGGDDHHPFGGRTEPRASKSGDAVDLFQALLNVTWYGVVAEEAGSR